MNRNIFLGYTVFLYLLPIVVKYGRLESNTLENIDCPIAIATTSTGVDEDGIGRIGFREIEA
jgi:hypothetical protein